MLKLVVVSGCDVDDSDHSDDDDDDEEEEEDDGGEGDETGCRPWRRKSRRREKDT